MSEQTKKILTAIGAVVAGLAVIAGIAYAISYFLKKREEAEDDCCILDDECCCDCEDEEECHDVVESVRDGVNEDTVCRNTGDSGDCKTFVDVDQLSSNPGGDKHDTGNRCCGRVNDVCKLLAGDAVFVAERSHNRTND